MLEGSPKRIRFRDLTKFELVINLDAAKAPGLSDTGIVPAVLPRRPGESKVCAPRRAVDVSSLTDNARLIFLTRILVGMVKGAFTSALKRRSVMTKFGLIGAAVLSLVLASPTMAMHRHHHHHYFHAHGVYNDFARRNTFN